MLPGAQPPNRLTRPPGLTEAMASDQTSATPVASIAIQAPLPPWVLARTTSAWPPPRAISMVSAAPSFRPISRRPGLGSARMTRCPSIASAATKRSPIAPAPKTRTSTGSPLA